MIYDPLIRRTHIVGERTRERAVWPPTPEMRAQDVYACGNTAARFGFRFETRGWGYGQVMACVGGEGRARINGRWELMAQGYAYVTPPGTPHAYEAVEDKPWFLTWVTFDGPIERTPLAGIDSALLLQVDPRGLYQANLGMYREVIGPSDPEMLHAWTELIRLQAMRITGSLRGGQQLWRVWEAVDADPQRLWTVRDLAEIVGTSGEHLRRLCIQQVDRSPMEQVTHLRMRRAAKMLMSSKELKIDSIARAVGYRDRFGFSVAFKRSLGSTPAAYRKSHQGSRS